MQSIDPQNTMLSIPLEQDGDEATASRTPIPVVIDDHQHPAYIRTPLTALLLCLLHLAVLLTTQQHPPTPHSDLYRSLSLSLPPRNGEAPCPHQTSHYEPTSRRRPSTANQWEQSHVLCLSTLHIPVRATTREITKHVRHSRSARSLRANTRLLQTEHCSESSKLRGAFGRRSPCSQLTSARNFYVLLSMQETIACQ